MLYIPVRGASARFYGNSLFVQCRAALLAATSAIIMGTIHNSSAVAASLTKFTEETAQPTEINFDNFEEYLPIIDGVNRLRGSDIQERQCDYTARQCDYILQGNIMLENFAIDKPNTSFSIDTSRNEEDFASVYLEGSLQIDAGKLSIKSQDESYGFMIPNIDCPMGNDSHEIEPLVTQNGGFIDIDSKDSSYGLYSMKAMRVTGGQLSLKARDKAKALYIMESYPEDSNNGRYIFYKQTSGDVRIKSSGSGSVGMENGQSAEISGGSLNIHAQNSGIGIILNNGNAQFNQQDGAISIKAEDDSIGLHSSQFRMDGGKMRLQGSESGKAISLYSDYYSNHEARFLFHGGLLQIAAKEQTASGGVSDNKPAKQDRAYAVYGDDGSHALFGGKSALQPILSINAAGKAETGFMSFGTVQIERNAKLEMPAIDPVANSWRLTKTAPIEVSFLESRNAPIDGVFTAANEQHKLFFDYEAALSDDKKHYVLRLQPKSGRNAHENGAPDMALRVSDIAGGNNKRTAKALERALSKADIQTETALHNEDLLFAAADMDKVKPAEQNTPYRKLGAFYDRLYNSDKGGERNINAQLRDLSPYQATRLPAMTLEIQTHFADDFRRALLKLSAPENTGHTGHETQADAEAQKIAKNSRRLWDFWLKPVGVHGKYRAQNSSFTTLTADYGGMSFGTVTMRDTVAFGLTGSFDDGRLHGENSYSADMRHFFAGGGLAALWELSDKFHPIADISASYGNARFKQRRRDSLNAGNHASIDQNSFLISAALTHYYGIENYQIQLAPQIGLDYAYIRQGSWKEKGEGLPLIVKGAGFNAMRAKIGSSVLWNVTNMLTLNAYGAYRYNFLDTNINLDAAIRQAEAAAWKTRGENSKRSSANAGVNIAYRLFPSATIGAVYDISAQEKRIIQQFSAEAKLLF